MKKIFLLLGFVFVMQDMVAQELNANVTINAPKLQTADPKVFKTLETAIRNMLNNTAWTDDIYEQGERINVIVNLNITKELSATSFEADLAIQATRPVFNSGKETILFSHSDRDVNFTYVEYQPVEYTQNTYNDNLSQILSFYAYIILGLDYDSFSSLGGSFAFQEAQNILTTVPPNVIKSFPGWGPIGEGQRNRYWLIENILSPRVEPFRKSIYDYHLRGLDRMSQDPEKGRTAIFGAIQKMAEVNKAYPNSMILQLMSNAKRQEILEIFIKAGTVQKKAVYEAMRKVDGANASKYNPLR